MSSMGNPSGRMGATYVRMHVHRYLHAVNSSKAQLNVTNRPPARAMGSVTRRMSS
eukprot:CAMPEP_0201276994 /NCGR_PEP_ID=MMETSP0853-20130426/58024_1 /ASSEMBLY_ACC=CAM_ASM_000640 /TAXON_ID=183588 /ORGANISM="Pseudo-nitzschia fraudulenta, Strain WWA7" /LENGTH=54 /DNA_ID=CAMNT_0047585055 /DNA_START=30 /DNA_END=191 /DNA_ORIENTATION=+